MHAVAHFADVLDGRYAEVSQFADMNQSVLAGKNFDKCAEFTHSRNRTFVKLPFLDLGGDKLDLVDGLVQGLFAEAEDLDGAIVGPVDLRSLPIVLVLGRHHHHLRRRRWIR